MRQELKQHNNMLSVHTVTLCVMTPGIFPGNNAVGQVLSATLCKLETLHQILSVTKLIGALSCKIPIWPVPIQLTFDTLGFPRQLLEVSTVGIVS